MMEFGEFIFSIRPQKIEVALGRVIHQTLPDGDMITEASVQDLGSVPRVVTGEGVFVGETAEADFAALTAKMTGSALLVVPGVGQWQAYLSELTYCGESGTDSVGYTFRFVEAMT